MQVEGKSIPSFLGSLGDLSAHMDKQFDGLSNKEKGDKYERFVQKLIPFSDIGSEFRRPVRREKSSYDKGIDLIADSESSEDKLLIQAKYSLTSKDDIDNIVSKFEDAEKSVLGKEKSPNLFAEQNDGNYYYVISAPRKLNNILNKYRNSELSSVSFFEDLKSAGKIEVVDLEEIRKILLSCYRKQNFIPTNVELNSRTKFIRQNDVYVGILSATEIKRIYEEFGNSLFLENIREYLGPKSGKEAKKSSQNTVNESISETLKQEPELFLARNNGIAIRASQVQEIEEDVLNLSEASVVNGCQTTMSIVKNPNDISNVLVKVVETENSWDIAEAANFQNEIKQIDLRLARYITPQKVRQAATKFGVDFEGSKESNAFSIIDSIYDVNVTYDEVKSLFIGLFSRSPTNTLKRDYTNIKRDLLENVYRDGSKDYDDEDYIFDILFRLNAESKRGAEKISESLGDKQRDVFKRFWNEENPKYRAVLTILASCVAVGKNIYSDPGFSYSEFKDFVDDLEKILDNNASKLSSGIKYSFVAVAQDILELDKSQRSRQMHNVITSMDFEEEYEKTLLMSDTIN